MWERERERERVGAEKQQLKEGHKGVKKRRKREWQWTKKNQGEKGRGGGWGSGKRGGRATEEWKRNDLRGWGMEGEVEGARGRSIKAVEKKKREREREREGERQWKQLARGGCHPWLPLITHSLMTLFFSFPVSRFFSVGAGGEGVRPAPDQTGSFGVHHLQVGPSSAGEMFVDVSGGELRGGGGRLQHRADVWVNKKMKLKGN